VLGAYNQLLHGITLVSAHDVSLALHSSNIPSQSVETVMRVPSLNRRVNHDIDPLAQTKLLKRTRNW
ncbi:uncharacterized protein METZ01_LOCUS7880, partial [marine metagenome]